MRRKTENKMFSAAKWKRGKFSKEELIFCGLWSCLRWKLNNRGVRKHFKKSKDLVSVKCARNSHSSSSSLMPKFIFGYKIRLDGEKQVKSVFMWNHSSLSSSKAELKQSESRFDWWQSLWRRDLCFSHYIKPTCAFCKKESPRTTKASSFALGIKKRI